MSIEMFPPTFFESKPTRINFTFHICDQRLFEVVCRRNNNRFSCNQTVLTVQQPESPSHHVRQNRKHSLNFLSCKANLDHDGNAQQQVWMENCIWTEHVREIPNVFSPAIFLNSNFHPNKVCSVISQQKSLFFCSFQMF